MNPILELTKAAITANAKEVSRASNVLLEHFNLNNFYYYKIYESGDFFLFDDSRDVVDFLEVQQFVYKHPHYCHPRYHRSSCLIEKTSENPLLIGLETTKNYFLKSEFNLAISIVNKTGNAVEEFGFHSAQSDEKQIRFLFNHMPELRLFIQWFKENNAPVISFLEKNTVNLSRVIGDIFYDNRIQKGNPYYQERKRLLQTLSIQSEPNLTSTDWSVINLIIRGSTASQIADQLFRSKRTIEHRIEILKEKLNCCSKVELIQKAQELHLCYPSFS